MHNSILVYVDTIAYVVPNKSETNLQS